MRLTKSLTRHEDIYYKIEGKVVEERGDDNFDIGANPSAEEEAEETTVTVSTGIDVVLAQRLVEMGTTKDQYKKDIKTYVKSLLQKVKESNPERANFLKTNLQPCITKWLQDFKDITAFKGESMEEEGTYVLCKYPSEEYALGTKVELYILKDAVEQEKI